MRLISFEMRKLFCSKITIITVMLVLIINIGSALSDAHTWRKYIGDVDIYNKMLQPYAGKLDKKLASKIKTLPGSSEGYDTSSSLSYEQRRKKSFEESYYYATEEARTWNFNKYENPDKPYSVTGLSNLCSALESRGEKDSYLYSDTLKNLNLLKATKEPGYYNTTGWGAVFRYLVDFPTVIFISIVLIMVIGPIFSNEKKNNMEKIILSTKMGLRKIVSAKIIASLVFTIAWVTLFYVVMCLVNIIPYGALIRGNIPLNSLDGYLFTPYNLTVIQALGIIYLITILSAWTLAIIFCLISSLSKKNFTSIVCALVFVIVPMYIKDDGEIAKALILFPSIIMSGKAPFKGYISFDIMNTPVMYPTVAVIVLIITLLVAILLTFKAYSRKIKV
ncbi:ABC transporter permease subunit [Clostridium tagluense]|uniref:ABC transporter permease subunit n=1 Tax=Clostridium tagluense TaxID=360422 RepID=UPI001C6DE0F2|nr:ABC transporter permease subunit [Clostridium tagluense]MBW9155486.1 ABC transporter permease subunit [Clostridium tagluense]WLC66116.1 hypothetical protein KTC93_02405 [Clostridium tagluense]